LLPIGGCLWSALQQDIMILKKKSVLMGRMKYF